MYNSLLKKCNLLSGVIELTFIQKAKLFLIFTFVIFLQTLLAQSPQNPSPMQENIRTHERITKKNFEGINFFIENLLSKKVEVFISKKDINEKNYDLLIHFNGAGYVVKYAAENYNGALISVIVNLGAGSKIYYDEFNDTTLFKKLIDSIKINCEKKLAHHIIFNKIILSGFSAGYGAVKHLLDNYFNEINSILLLDGLHAGYVPEGKVLFEGGKVDSTSLKNFIKFAKNASGSKNSKRFLFTHSEIFPGTYVSTTEAADFIIKKLNLKINPVLKWGPLGMQLLGEVRKNNFQILAFAGNTAPDHIDHLHGLFYFLNMLSDM